MKDAERIGFDMPKGISPKSGLRDDGAGDGLIYQEVTPGSPAEKVAMEGSTTKGLNQVPAGVTRKTVKGKGTRTGSFEIC